MDKYIKTTPKGDRQRHRQARRQQPPAKPLEGNHIRVRAVRRQEIDATKLSLAFWLLAKQLVDDQTDAATAEDHTPPEEPTR